MMMMMRGPAAGGAPGRAKSPGRPGGAKRRLLQLLLAMAWIAAPEASSGPESCIPRNLRCFKSCCETPSYCRVNCTWDAECKADANYTLSFRNRKEWKSFEAGGATSFLWNQSGIHVLSNVTVWVERRAADGALHASDNLTLLISEAVQFSAALAKNINISRSKGILTLTWPDPPTCRSRLPRKKEARMRPAEEAEWSPVTRDSFAVPGKSCQGNYLCSGSQLPALPKLAAFSNASFPRSIPSLLPLDSCRLSCRYGNCSSADDGGKEKLGVACRLEKDIPYWAQVRYRTSHWSSYWSDWSESILVPAEILSSPKVNYTVQHLGGDGRRNVTLEWESLSAQHREVTYCLTFVLLPCQPCQDSELQRCVQNQTSYHIALSGAGYNVSMEATNAAGSSPAYFFEIPPERGAGPNFLNISRSGGNLTLKWEAKMNTYIFCIEKQALGEATMETPCSEEDPAASNTHESSASLEPNKCYRLAVHGGDWNLPWSTFGLKYLFHRRPSLEGRIPVNVTNATTHSVLVQWDPPGGLSNCPGVLEKYIICCRSEADGKITNHEANTSETQYTIRNLQPRTAYYVGVWASTAETKESCEARVRFLTKPPDPKEMALTHIFLYLGVFLGILVATCVFHYGKKRVTDMFWPPLLDPANVEALKILTATENGQVRLQRGFIEPQESGGLSETLVVELPPDKEEPGAGTSVDVPGLATAVEEMLLPAGEDQGASGGILPSSEYKGQGLLSPMEDERLGGCAGVSQEAGASGCSLPSPLDAEAGDGQCLPPPNAPLSFVLLDKVVVIKNGDGDFAFLHHHASA